jgi:Mg2+ and Co2+ transporter CorA
MNSLESNHRFIAAQVHRPHGAAAKHTAQRHNMPTPIEYKNADIIGIAKAQRSLMRAVCAVLLINVSFFVAAQAISAFLAAQAIDVGGPSDRLSDIVGALAVWAFILLEMFITGFYTFRLNKAMKARRIRAWFWSILAGLFAWACVGLLIMAMVSSDATKILKSRGLKVGFMGVSRLDLERWQSANKPT